MKVILNLFIGKKKSNLLNHFITNHSMTFIIVVVFHDSIVFQTFLL
jgi:hypothetical protein